MYLSHNLPTERLLAVALAVADGVRVVDDDLVRHFRVLERDETEATGLASFLARDNLTLLDPAELGEVHLHLVLGGVGLQASDEEPVGALVVLHGVVVLGDGPLRLDHLT
jgi:hypothetical protein